MQKFRFGGYMNATSGGTNSPGHPGNQNYSNSNSGSSNSPGHPGNNNNNNNTYTSPGHPSNQSNLSIANTTGNTDTSGDYSNNPSNANLSFPDDNNKGATNAPGASGILPVLENLGSSNLEKLMSMYDPKGLAYNFTNMLSNANLGITNEYGDYIAHENDPYAYTSSGDYIYQNAEMGEPGAILIDGEFKKPVFNKLGEALMDSATTGSYDDGIFTMDPFVTSSDDMFTGIPTSIDEFNEQQIDYKLDQLKSNLYGGGGGGGGSSGYGGGGGGNAAAYAMMNQGPKQLGAGEDVPGQTELLDYMVNVNRYNPYTKMAMPQMAAGGIMELMR